MNNSIDILLETLQDTTYQSKKILQEGSNAIDRIFQLQLKLYNAVNGTLISMTPADKELIDKVLNIDNNTYDYKLLSYSNIDNHKKYGIEADCNVEYVIKAILDHMDNPSKEFNSKKINEEAICKTYNELTHNSFSHKTMNTDEFKYEFRSTAFGGFKKVIIIPNKLNLVNLFSKSLYNINHINDNLYKYIDDLKKYYNIIEDKYNKIKKINPNASLNTYLSCLETGIRNTLIMYKAIRSTFYELNTEYRHIFGELIRIDNELKSKSLDESIVNSYNSIFDKVESLTETISSMKEVLTEDTSNNEIEKLSIISKSFKSLLSSYEYQSKACRYDRDNMIQKIKNKYGLISRISIEDLKNKSSNCVYTIYPNIINKIDMSSFISTLNNKIDFCKTQFYDLVKDNKIQSKNIILDKILEGFFFYNGISTEDNLIGKLMTNIQTKILNKHIITNISNFDVIFDNIITIPDYLDQINNMISKLDDTIIYLLNGIIGLNNKENIELVIENIIKTYIAFSSLISCVFYNLCKLENKSIELVQNLIDDFN